MKVLYIVNSTRTVGGATKSFLTLVFGMRARGIEPLVVTPDRGDLYQILSDKGIKVLSVSYRMNIYPNLVTVKDFFLFLPRLIARRCMEHHAVHCITEFCRENSVNLIHSNVGVVSCGLSAAKHLNIPHVFHIREYGDLDFGYHHYPSRRRFYQNLSSTYTICITKGIQEYHRLKGACSRVIYNGIDVETDGGHSEFSQEHFFLFAGRLEASKDFMQVVKAYDAFRQQNPTTDVVLKVAGPISDSAYWSSILFYIKEHRLEQHVAYIGVRKDVNRLMHDAQAVIVSSVSEAFGRCLPEAMLNDCLTIGRNTGGTKEQYDNGVEECGAEIGLRYETEEELAALMTKVALAEAGAFDAMKSNAKAVVQKLYGVETYIDGVESFYCEILSSNQKSQEK